MVKYLMFYKINILLMLFTKLIKKLGLDTLLF